MRISVDFDGVLADTDSLLRQTIRDEFKIIVPQGAIKHHNLQESLGISAKEAETVYRKALVETSCLPPMPFAFKTVRELKQEGHELFLATMRWDKPPVEAWLRKNGIDFFRIVWLHNKEKMPNVDVHIDDYVTKLLRLMPYIEVRAFLLTQSWNEGCLNVKSNLERVDSWVEFHNRIKELSKVREG